MKKGYFIGNCLHISIKINENEKVDFPVFNENIKFTDIGLNIEITDKKTKFAWFFKNVLEGKYLEVNEEIIEKVCNFFPNENIKFVEVKE